MIMFYISYGCTYVNGTAAFRIPWGVQAVPAILLFFGMMFLPESPRYLAAKDRWEESLEVLALTHGNGDRNHPVVINEYEEIKEWCRLEAEANAVSYLELIQPHMINRTHIAVFVQIWSQLTGMNVMSECFIHLPVHPQNKYANIGRHSVLHNLHLPHGRYAFQSRTDF